MNSRIICLAYGLVCLLSPLGIAEESNVPAEMALAHYVAKPDDSHAWQVVQRASLGMSEYLEIKMTSQTWRGIPWKHQLFIILPSQVDPSTKHAMLFISGGRWRTEMDRDDFRQPIPRVAALFAAVAEQQKTPVAILLQVPFQPLFDGKYEDALIAYTFEEFLKTGDSQRPLLLPMVKAAVRGMDVVQTACQDSLDIGIETFTVTGASKRGWTTWLTGAVDPRATAIAPIVIDVVNMGPQMRHQESVWGKFSHEIDDYTSRDLPKRLETPRGRELQLIVDPFSYREHLTQSKLIIIGTNDPYWPVDALNLYWDQLLGQKHILYVPNQGHGIKDFVRLTSTLNEFHRRAGEGKCLPQLKWNYKQNGSFVDFRVSSDEPTQTLRIWTARSETRDFRDSRWSDQIVKPVDGRYGESFALPEEGFVATFAEAVYAAVPVPFFLSTKLVVLNRSGFDRAVPQ